MEEQDRSRTASDGAAEATTSAGVEDVSDDRTEPLSTKRELRKIIREDSNWSVRSITVTALTGVSVAVIATQLNGIVSSVALIAIMAFITASVSEIYRVSLALTGFGARRAAAQAARVLPLTLAEQRAERRSDGPSEVDNPITEALQVVASSYRLSEVQQSQHPGPLRRAFLRLRNYGKANPFLWLVVLFVAIAISTVSAVYLITDGQPPRIIQRTVSVEEQISTEDRASIVAEAKAQALAELRAETPAPSAPLASDQALVEELSSLTQRLATMETEISDLPVATPLPTPSPADPAMLERISALEAERDALVQRLAELEAEVAKPETNPPAAGPTSSSGAVATS